MLQQRTAPTSGALEAFEVAVAPLRSTARPPVPARLGGAKWFKTRRGSWTALENSSDLESEGFLRQLKGLRKERFIRERMFISVSRKAASLPEKEVNFETFSLRDSAV